MPLPAGYKLDAPSPVKLPPGYTLDQTAPTDSGHAPDWTDDVKASAKFLGGELSGVGSALNPMNIGKGIYNTVVHPVDTATALAHLPGKMYDDYQSGNMDALSREIGNVAGGVIAGKVLPEVPGAAAKYGARVVENAPALGKAAGAVASDAVSFKPSAGDIGPVAMAAYFHNPQSIVGALMMKAAANVARGGNAGALKSAIVDLLTRPTTKEAIAASQRTPVWAGVPEGEPVTPPDQPGYNENGSYTLPSGRVVGGMQNQQPTLAPAPLGPRQAPAWQGIPSGNTAAPAPVEPIPGALPSGRVPGKITTQVKVSPDISVKASSDALGTTPDSAVGRGSPLESATQQKLATAAKDGTLNSLPAAQKAEIVKAVKAGDDSAVSDILDSHAGVRSMAQDVANKISILARYAKDHGVDLDTLDPADRQSIADLAIKHAQSVGMTGLPRAGKYRGISDATMEAVKQALQK